MALIGQVLARCGSRVMMSGNAVTTVPKEIDHQNNTTIGSFSMLWNITLPVDCQGKAQVPFTPKGLASSRSR